MAVIIYCVSLRDSNYRAFEFGLDHGRLFAFFITNHCRLRNPTNLVIPLLTQNNMRWVRGYHGGGRVLSLMM
jgi:hypothetical protein